VSPLSLLTMLTLPIVGLVSLVAGGWWTWALPVEVFVLVPLVELCLPARPTAPMGEGAARWKVAVADAVIYSLIPLHALILSAFVILVSRGAFPSLLSCLGATVTTGICCGAIGINVAHELGHRASPVDRFLAKALLLTALYQHFFVEHNRGHHAKVGTPGDPASALRGETVYAFWVRSIVGSYRSAWRLENARLCRSGRSPLGFGNEMVRFHIAESVFVAAVALAGGPLAAALAVVAALFGVLLLETVNYIEHYGLRREAVGPDAYERVRPAHSWNSNHPISRVLLFELTRHSDHHAHPGRRWSELRHFEDSPQLPTGYPGLIVLALFPPLWFAVMHQRLETEQDRLTAMESAALV
jgi:alkane 1-monooxygenase